MSEKARALGIPEEDLTKAMVLVRNLRAHAINMNLDPRATRIALIFANLVDYHFARKQLSLDELIKLEEIAGDLYEQARRRT